MKIGEAKSTGNAFIDDNHDKLLVHLERICSALRDDRELDEFKSSLKNLFVDLENHFSHEEIILKGANFEDLDQHADSHRELSMFLRWESMELPDYDEAVNFLAIARSRIFSHELLEDQSYWPLFEADDSDATSLISWSAALETGNQDIDLHHKAIANYINRFHRRLTENPSIEATCNDLRAVYAYSEQHFSEEEGLLGPNLRLGHKESHERLISDLAVLIDEVKAGTLNAEHIGEYLKYWVLNHIQNFDITAFLKVS